MHNGIQTQILILLKPGKYNAIPGRVLANRLGFKDDRAIRIGIEGLIQEGYPIAASVNPPCGYFLATTTEEINEYMGILRARGKEIFLRRRHFRDASRQLYEPGKQLKLELVVK